MTDCRSPSYPIVQASQHVGIVTPEDVRWEPIPSSASPERCICGMVFPVCASFDFTFGNGNIERYRLGQCHYCGTCYWKQLERKPKRKVEPTIVHSPPPPEPEFPDRRERVVLGLMALLVVVMTCAAFWFTLIVCWPGGKP